MRVMGEFFMIDYKLKSKIFRDYPNMIYDIKKAFAGLWFNDYFHMTDKTCYNILSYYKTNYPNEYKECERIINADYKRIKRARLRIAKIISGDNPVFITLTISPEYYNKISNATFRRYATRCLSGYDDYVGNEDWGEENGRFHLHFVACGCSRVNWIYGFVKIKPIINKDDISLAKYINKITNHALKETCKRTALIYKRS